MSDFPYRILDDVAHRPWPLPDGPWIMTQSWHDLLFAHWPVDARALRDKLPAGFELDTFEGQAWIGVVPFHMTNVAPRGVPSVPFVSAFLELNVRTYVTPTASPGCTSSAWTRTARLPSRPRARCFACRTSWRR